MASVDSVLKEFSDAMRKEVVIKNMTKQGSSAAAKFGQQLESLDAVLKGSLRELNQLEGVMYKTVHKQRR